MTPDEPISVLITGAGSELAFSILKACNLSTIPLRIVACDIGSNALGLYWADKAYLVPAVRKNPDEFLKALQDIIRLEKVRVVFPTPDHELAFLPKHRDSILRDFGCHIIVNSFSEMKRFNDKWLAYQWYIAHELPTPKTIRGDEVGDEKNFLSIMQFPVILKPSQGGGSRSIFFVHEFVELMKYLPVVPEPLIQEYLEPSDEEYTAGTYRTLHNEVYVIVLRRELKFGMTYKAEVVFDEILERFCRQVIHNTNLQGVNNIQFRKTNSGPKILEINPRFSSTTGIRAYFGFNEPEMVVREYVMNQRTPAPIIMAGKVLRYMHEAYIQPEAADTFINFQGLDTY
jgi:carbamoyl-phosphate synthase large subunit